MLFRSIQQIKVLDADTVDFYLKQADSAFPSKLIIGILPAKTIAAGGDVGHHPIGSGPLKFENWQHVLKLKRVNDGEVISLLEVKDPTVRVLKLLRGEVDILQGDLPPELVKYLKKQNAVNVQEAAGANFSYLGFNCQDRKSTRLNSSHSQQSRMPSSA